jgi:pyridoxamine 5'-phosphate oxidase family protein
MTMAAFTEAEIEYLQSQRLGRLATVNAKGEPHIAPVAFRYNPEHESIDIGGLDVAKTRKYRDVAAGRPIAFVVDDVILEPWKARGIEIRGHAQALEEGGKSIMEHFGDAMIRISPTRIIAWGIETDPYQANARDVK